MSRKRQQRELERIELLARRTALAIVERGRADLHTPERRDTAQATRHLLVGAGIRRHRAAAAQCRGLHRLARSSFARGAELDQRHLSLPTLDELAVLVQDVGTHVHCEALGSECIPALRLTDQIAQRCLVRAAVGVL